MLGEEVVWVKSETLRDFMFDVFKSVGVPEGDAQTCSDVLIAADKQGIDSHGISRLKPIYIDRILAGQQSPVTIFEVIRERPTTAVVDGHRGMGMVVAKKAMRMAIQKAKKLGMGMVAVRNSTHFGIAGYYAQMAVDEGLIGIIGTNARPSIPPTFGTENMLGTNPLTFGMPNDEPFPFMLDCATSIIQRGKVEVLARNGKKVQEGLVIDNNGEYMTDPNEILQGLTKGKAALLPIGGLYETGGYKGYGYATVVEILSASLQGGAFLKALTGTNLGHFFIAIDITAFTELDDFKKITGEILRGLRASRKMPGYDRIYTAGEKEYLTYLEREKKGIPINKSLQKELKQLKEDCSLKSYLPF
ncbi:MAG: Ldh family oxidoreductase [Candidatus Bathyarchaeia archaeon]|jgi:LDH2 family malate/lactate/ureidoglycolate dehydrogenase